jgi:hypothetical protein
VSSGANRTEHSGADGRLVRLVVLGRSPGARTIAYARAKVLAAARAAGRPVSFARLTLTHEERRANPEPAGAEVLVEVGGRSILARARGRSTREAVDRLEQRLRRRLQPDHGSRRGQDRRGAVR